ncbi:MAG: Ldh family oxidoreductase [Propionicimonas sp.]
MILTHTELGDVLGRALPGANDADLDLIARATLAAHQHGQGWAGLALLGRELAGPRGLPGEPAGAGGFRRISGEGVPGPLCLAGGVRHVAELAAEFGVAAIGLPAITGTGRLAGYAAGLARRGLVGIVLAQSAPAVAPWTGDRAAIGTNPFCLAAPHADGLLVLDTATSELTKAALTSHRADRTPLPEGAALDATGQPTTDAEAATTLLARGLIGSLAGLAIEVVAGALLGVEDTPGRGLLVLGLDPQAVGTDLTSQVSAIAARWQAAGGHLPGAVEQLPAEAPVSEAEWDLFLSQVGVGR